MYVFFIFFIDIIIDMSSINNISWTITESGFSLRVVEGHIIRDQYILVLSVFVPVPVVDYFL